MFYNQELFDKAGIEVPTTFDEALEEAEEFYNKTGAYLFMPDEFFNILFESFSFFCASCINGMIYCLSLSIENVFNSLSSRS